MCALFKKESSKAVAQPRSELIFLSRYGLYLVLHPTKETCMNNSWPIYKKKRGLVLVQQGRYDIHRPTFSGSVYEMALINPDTPGTT